MSTAALDRANQNTYSVFSNFSSENCAFYEIMRTNEVEPDRTQMKHNKTLAVCMLGNLRLQTHSGYVIINAFPLQQWLHERTSVLRYTYFALLVLFV